MSELSGAAKRFVLRYALYPSINGEDADVGSGRKCVVTGMDHSHAVFRARATEPGEGSSLRRTSNAWLMSWPSTCSGDSASKVKTSSKSTSRCHELPVDGAALPIHLGDSAGEEAFGRGGRLGQYPATGGEAWTFRREEEACRCLRTPFGEALGPIQATIGAVGPMAVIAEAAYSSPRFWFSPLE